MKQWLRRLLPLAFWLGVWACAAFFVGKELLLPGPATVFSRLVALAGQGFFWQTAFLSLLRIFIGFLLGTGLGVLLACATSASYWAHAVLAPAIRVIRATPVASFIILVLLWVEKGRVPGLIAALMVLPVVWETVSRGVSETDGALLELARAYRFGRGKTLRLVYVPSVLPYFAGGCRTALGLAWKAGVAAEVLCLPRFAIGTEMYGAKLYLETPTLFAWTLVVIALSFILERCMAWALGKLEKTRGAVPAK